MRKVKIASAAINQTPLDFKGNRDRIAEVIQKARDMKVNVLSLPEMVVPGYGCDDAFHHPYLQDECWYTLDYITDLSEEMLISIGAPIEHKGSLYNCVVVIYDSEIIAIIPKRDLAGDGIHYESRWFEAWPRGQHEVFEHACTDIPFGDLMVNMDGITISWEICEEFWRGRRFGSGDIIINPSASHTAPGKIETRRRKVMISSNDFACVYVYTNLLGCSSGRAIYDGDNIIASAGELLADSERFQLSDYTIVTAVVDIERNRVTRARLSRPYKDTTHVINGGGGIEYFGDDALTRPIPERPVPEYRHFEMAMTLGLFDYMRKSRSKGFALSLSGGYDSTTVALLVNMMTIRIFKELHYIDITQKIGYMIPKGMHITLENLKDLMLVCVYQGSEGISSDNTFQAAEAIAKAVGARFVNWSIGHIVNLYQQRVQTYISGSAQRDITWDTDDIAMQNLQARVRAPGVWMIANIDGRLLLTTSNRSEAAVGYATMDGDTAGGLAPIAGVSKKFIREWLQNIVVPQIDYELLDPNNVLALERAVHLVTGMEPTAELRPGATQTDEDDLMPYDLMDDIEYNHVHHGRAPHEVFEVLNDGTNPDKLKGQIKKWFRLWRISQWKRERYAISFHFGKLNLDPKTWCRFPVLSGPVDFTKLDEIAKPVVDEGHIRHF
jgi:NAD+ synthase (glutamine-hydrolysing)